MKSFYFLLCLPIFIFSQKKPTTVKKSTANPVGYTINLNTENINGQKIYLSLYNGNIKNAKKKDSVLINSDKQKISFKETKKIIPHIAQLSTSSNKSTINIVLNNGEILDIDLKTDVLTDATIKQNQNIEFLNYQKTNVLEEKNKFLNSFITKYPNSVLSYYSELELRKFKKNEYSKDSLGMKNFIKDIDLNSKMVKLLPNMYTFLNAYFTIAPTNNENYYKGVEMLLKNQKCESLNYSFYLTWIFKNLEFNESNKLMDTYDKVFNNYMNETVCLEKYKTLYERALDKMNKMKSLPLSSEFPDLEVIDNQKNVSKISDYNKDSMVFILFYDPNCEHCQKDVPEIVKYFEELEKPSGKKMQKIAFLNVATTTDWDEFIKTSGLKDWINITTTADSLPILQKYNINSNPSYFILDKKGVILSKNYSKEFIHKIFTE